MLCSRSFPSDSIAPRLRARPGLARRTLATALGLMLGLSAVGCTFNPSGQEPGDPGPGPGPGPGVDAGQPLDAGQPRDGGAAEPPDAPPAIDAGGPQKPTLPAWPVDDEDMNIDGDLREWSDDDWITLAPPADYRKEHDPSNPGASDISMRFAARWHPSAGLYLAFEVTDDQHQVAPGGNDVLWRGDSVQTGFDVGLNGGSAGYDTTDDFEYGWALSSNGQEREHRWAQGNGAAGSQTEFEVVRDGSTTIYEVRMPLANLSLSDLTTGRRIGFSVLLNEDDADPDFGDLIRDGWLEWTPGMAGIPKEPGQFGVIELRGQPVD